MSQSGGVSTTWALEGNAAERYEQFVVPAILGPFARALVDVAGPGPGDTVVDVGCGTGAASLYTASLLQGSGEVVGVDVSPEMLAVARVRAQEEGVDIDWREADARSLPLDEASTDCVVCAQTLQFVPDKPPVLAEMRRVLKPGGVAAISAWCPLDQNPYFEALVSALTRHIGADLAQGLGAAFALGDPAEVGAMAETAGFTEVGQEAIEKSLELPPLASFAESHILATPMAAGYQAAPTEVRAAVVDDVVRSFDRPRIPFSSHVFIARV